MPDSLQPGLAAAAARTAVEAAARSLGWDDVEGLNGAPSPSAHPLGADPTLAEAAEAVASGAVTSEQLTRACLDAIARDNARTSWFVRVAEEQALERARACDLARRAGAALGPLHGVPLAHKDMFARAGELMECGSRILAGYRPARTSTLLQRLDAAGAVTLGALHMAEFALSPVGDNAHLGARPNPWHPAHVTGGSSSGSGAAVAARQVFGALGSDTGGSVRLPAACCGVTGLKPTQGLVPMDGVMPLAPSLDCAGFLARTAEDCARLLAVATRQPAAGPDTDGGAVAVPHFDADIPLTDELRAGVARAAEMLREAGFRLRRVKLPELGVAGQIGTLVLGAEAASVHGRWLRTREAEYGALVHRRIARGLAYAANEYVDALRLRPSLCAAFLREHLAGADALLLPTLPEPVPTIAETTCGDLEAIEARIGRFSYWTRAINLLGLPALALPAGFTASGLPMGVQLVGPPGSDAALCRIGQRFQRASDWHRRRPRAGT